MRSSVLVCGNYEFQCKVSVFKEIAQKILETLVNVLTLLTESQIIDNLGKKSLRGLCAGSARALRGCTQSSVLVRGNYEFQCKVSVFKEIAQKILETLFNVLTLLTENQIIDNLGKKSLRRLCVAVRGQVS